MRKLPIVAIVGRTNVGKSTLFNKLSESKKAIVSKLAGTTRDRTYAELAWRDREFKLVDTGGLDLYDDTLKNQRQDIRDEINDNIQNQAQFAITEAELILFLIDVKSGIMPQDKELLKILKKTKKPIILVANKADTRREKEFLDNDIYQLNLKDVQPVSANNGTGCGDLLDIIVSILPPPKKITKTTGELSIAIIGRPNVGKSTLFNSIIGVNQAVISALPHTTRDSNDFSYLYKNKKITLIDTAGLRRADKIGRVRGQAKDVKQELSFIEKASMGQAMYAIKKAKIVVLILEVEKSMSQQDKKIAQIISDMKKPCLILANKWDLVENKDQNTIHQYEDYIYHNISMLDYADIMFISALKKQRTNQVIERCLAIEKKYEMKIPSADLEEFIGKFIVKHNPRKKRAVRTIPQKNPRLEIGGFKQIDVGPPVFKLLVKRPTDVSGAYINLIRNNLRERFDFTGTPIIIKTK